MKQVRTLAAVVAAVAISSCGGGGGGSSPPPPPPPPASATITLSATSGAATVQEDAATQSVTFAATVATTATTPIVIDAAYDTAFYASVVASPAGTAGGFSIVATTRSSLPTGAQSSPIQLRVCQETACTHVYAVASATYTLTLTVNPSEWVTYQRNASHSGYVPATLDPTKFVKAWETPYLNDPNREGGLIAVAGSVYFTVAHRLYSLSEATGAQNWMYEPADAGSWLSPPGYNNGKIYFPMILAFSGPIFNGDSTIRGVDATTGAPLTDSPFKTNGAPYGNPTFQDGAMYFAEQDVGGQRAYRYALPSGTTVWNNRYVSGYDSAQSVAVDQNQVYAGLVNGVMTIDKASGNQLPNQPPFGGSGAFGAISPVLTAAGHVIWHDAFDANHLIAVNKANSTIAWTGGTGYQFQPSTAGNTIYALHGTNVEAISDVNGAVLWSWPLPANDQVVHIDQNMIVTDNLLFVGTLKNAYAIDLTTHQAVWSYPSHGQLVISRGMMLYIFERTFLADSKVIAIKLT